MTAAVLWMAGRPLGVRANDVAPHDTTYEVNVLANMGFGAFSGFEYIAIWSAEAHDARRSIARAVWITAPIALALFALATVSVLAFTAPSEVDLIAPLSQAFGAAGHASPIFSVLASLVSAALALAAIGAASTLFSGASRMPLVAGWDGLLPAWFSRVHGRTGAPVNSVLFVGAMTIAFGALGMVGVADPEAFQILSKTSMVFYALAYVVMFAVPVIGATRRQASVPLRIAAAIGLASTTAFIVLAAFPLVHVANRGLFATKVIGTTLAGIAFALLLYRRGVRARTTGR